MTDAASSSFWQHVTKSASGALPNAEAFTVKAFDAHRLVPKVIVSKLSAHRAVTSPPPRKPVKGKGKAPIAGSKAKVRVAAGKKRKREDKEEEGEDLTDLLGSIDPADWSDDSDVEMGSQKEAPRRSARPKSSTAQAAPVEDDEDFQYGYATDGYGSDNSAKDKTWRPPGETDHSANFATASAFSSPPPSPAHPQPTPISTPTPKSRLDSPPLSPSIQQFLIQDYGHEDPQHIRASDTEASLLLDQAQALGLTWGVDSLVHPELLKVTVEQNESFKMVREYLPVWSVDLLKRFPVQHWEAFKKYGARAYLLGTKQRSIPLSARTSGDISFSFPPAVSSAMCISQIWHVFQARNATKVRALFAVNKHRRNCADAICPCWC